MKKYSFAGLLQHVLLCTLLCPLLCISIPALAQVAPGSDLAPILMGTAIFCTKTDSDGKPVDPGNTFTVNQKVIAAFAMPKSDKSLHVEFESRPDGTKTPAVWEAGASSVAVELKWEKPGSYTVTLYSKYTEQVLAEGEVTIVAYATPQAQPPAPAIPAPAQEPEATPSEPEKEPPAKPEAVPPTPPETQEPQIVLVPPAPEKAPTSEEEEDFRPAPRFESAGWVYLEYVPEKRWTHSKLLSIGRDADGLLITYSQITFKKGFYVGHWTTNSYERKLGPYERLWLREQKGSLNYTLDVAEKYDRFRVTLGPGLWRMAPPNRQNSFGNVSILVDGVEEYKKRFAWNSRNEEVVLDLSQAKTIQINMEGLEFVVGDPYFRKIK